MAVGNAIVNTARFKPLTVAEWAAPLKEYAAQHEATEAMLDAIDEDAAKYERYIRRNPNSEVAKQYRDFMSRIENEAAALSQYGMTPERRASLVGLKRSYNRQVRPIRTAVETLDDIEKQYLKDSKKGIIGAPDVDIEYLLEHPEYTVSDYKKSYTLADDVLSYSSNLFKGLTGYDTTPTTEVSPDGKYTIIMTPQGYTTQDYITALTGQGDGKVTPELENAIKTARDYFNYDNLSETDKRRVDQILLSAGSKYTKESKATVRNAPRGHKVTSTGKVVSKHKGYTPVTTDKGEVLYKKNGQYYKEDANGLPTDPVVNDITIGGKTFKQKPNAPAGTLVADTNSAVTPTTIFSQLGIRIPFAPQQPTIPTTTQVAPEPVTTEEDNEGFDW